MVNASFPVAANADDGIFSSSSGNEIWFQASAKIFFRFANVAIPRGSQITNAYICYYCNGYYCDGAYKPFHLYFEAADNPSAVVSDVDGNSRVLTTNWVEAYAYYGYSYKKWSGLAAIIQEIVNRSGWNAGNAMQCLCFTQSGEGYGNWVSVASKNSGNPAVLYVSYIPPSGGGAQIIGLGL